MRVLVVDDHGPTRRLVTAVLVAMDRGPALDVASADAAWAALRDEPFRAVITDQHMPGGSGVDLVRRIRRSDRDVLRTTPVMLMTGDATRLSVSLAREAGVDEFCLKPLTSHGLARRLHLLFSRPSAVDRRLQETLRGLQASVDQMRLSA